MASFLITRRDGSSRRVVVDDDDLERVRTHGRWSIDGHGYVTYGAVLDGERVDYKLHRWLLDLTPGDPDVDHIDGDPLNNQRSNLRTATNAQNHANLAIESCRGVSRYRGVYRRGQRFYAQQVIAGRTYGLGTFDTEDEAAAALAGFRAERGLGGY